MSTNKYNINKKEHQTNIAAIQSALYLFRENLLTAKYNNKKPINASQLIILIF